MSLALFVYYSSFDTSIPPCHFFPSYLSPFLFFLPLIALRLLEVTHSHPHYWQSSPLQYPPSLYLPSPHGLSNEVDPGPFFDLIPDPSQENEVQSLSPSAVALRLQCGTVHRADPGPT
jgi:hypothetical protein